LALIGGIVSLLVTGTNFSISAAVGFISLFGVSVLNGVVLIASINALRKNGSTLHDAVFIGSQLRLRPVVMASMAAAIGLLPAAFLQASGRKPRSHSARGCWRNDDRAGTNVIGASGAVLDRPPDGRG